MGTDKRHPQVMRELVDNMDKPPSIIFEKTNHSFDVLTEKRENTSSVSKKKDLGN